MNILLVAALLFGLTLLITATGFRRVTYFVSIGYAFAISAMAAATLLIFRQALDVLALAQVILMLAWGLRLGVFLLRREQRPSFQKRAGETTRQYARVSLPRKFAIWLGVSVLYGCMYLPSLLHAAGAAIKISSVALVGEVAGLLVMAGGLAIEALADGQKSAYKARAPQSFCNVGLFRLVRCPNYLGEILFWIGNWMMGIPFYAAPLDWIASLVGLACIILIMLGSTRRLERAQARRYGNQPEYQAYVRHVPVLIPFVPIYTLKNLRIYLE